MATESLIISMARTPIGSFQGALSSVPTVHLGATSIKSAIERAGIDGTHVNEVIMGNVLSANLGQAPARQAALGADLLEKTECMTINKVCGSGMRSIMLADQSIRFIRVF